MPCSYCYCTATYILFIFEQMNDDDNDDDECNDDDDDDDDDGGGGTDDGLMTADDYSIFFSANVNLPRFRVFRQELPGPAVEHNSILRVQML